MKTARQRSMPYATQAGADEAPDTAPMSGARHNKDASARFRFIVEHAEEMEELDV